MASDDQTNVSTQYDPTEEAASTPVPAEVPATAEASEPEAEAAPDEAEADEPAEQPAAGV